MMYGSIATFLPADARHNDAVPGIQRKEIMRPRNSTASWRRVGPQRPRTLRPSKTNCVIGGLKPQSDQIRRMAKGASTQAGDIPAALIATTPGVV